MGPRPQVGDTGTDMVNFRDVGGLPTGSGTRTTSGVLYRSDVPRRPGSPAAGPVSWPPALVLDLREPREGRPAHPLAGPRTRVVQVPLLARGHTADWLDVPSLTDLYQGTLRRTEERIAEVLDLLVSAAGPVLVHCAAGKDRTGVLVAVLLRAAGVSRSAVLGDYLRTEPNVTAILRRLALDLSALAGEDRLRAQHLAGTSEQALEAVLDELDDTPGGVHGWLRARNVPDVAVQAWTRRLVAGTAAEVTATGRCQESRKAGPAPDEPDLPWHATHPRG